MKDLPFTYDKGILHKQHLTKDDVLGTDGTGVMAGDAKCKVCGKFRVSGLTVCKECIEIYCDDHIYRHPFCDAGR